MVLEFLLGASWNECKIVAESLRSSAENIMYDDATTELMISASKKKRNYFKI